MFRSPRLLALFLALPLAAGAAAQERVVLEAKFVPATARPGDTVVLEVQCEVEAGYHIYGSKDPGEPTRLTVQEAGGLQALGEPQIPLGTRHEAFGMTNFWIEGTSTLKQSFQVPKDSKPGEVSLRGTVSYMACTPTFCDPPGKEKFTAKLTIEAGAAGSAAAGNAAAGSVAQDATPAPAAAAPPQKIKVQARVEPSPARAGEVVKLVVDVEVDPEYHVYGSAETIGPPITIAAKLDGALTAKGTPVVPPGDRHEGSSQEEHWLTGKFTLSQAVQIEAGVVARELTIAGTVPYTACTESTCLLPASVPFQASIAIEAGTARPEFLRSDAASAPAAGNGGGKAPAPDSGSLLLLLLSCIGGGLFALAMPCTYPLIPITFSFFTKQAEKRGGKVLPLALVYGIGIVLMFTLVGAALAGVIVDVVNHWFTNAFIGAAFFLFAFVLFGWINLQPPAFLTNIAGRASQGGSYLSVFFMGATLVISSFTCTAPIVGTLLGNVAQYGVPRVALGMSVFGLTMAAPFVVLALVPGRVKQMPRAGEWMETLKISLGFVELAAAFKFVSQLDIAMGWQLLPRELFLMLWSAICVLWAMFLFGILRKRGTSADGVGNGRMASGMLVSLLAAYFLFGALGYKLDFVMTSFAPPYSAAVVTGRSGQGSDHKEPYDLVKDDYPTAVALARREGKLLLINFTGFN